jgi:hypothetical protein
MTPKKLMLAALLAGAFLPAVGAELADQPVAPALAHEKRFVITTPGALGGPVHLNNRVIKNAPYSAGMVSERVQNLADGNQISTKTSTMSYRDSAGRTRYETRDDKGELRSVTIQDPVAGATWVLHPETKTATKLGRFGFWPGLDGALAGEAGRAAAEAHRAAAEAARAGAEAGRAAAEAARAHIEQLRKEGKLPTVERRQTANGEEIVIKNVQVEVRNEGKGDGNVETRQESRIQIGPVLAGAFSDRKWSGNVTTKDLGTREFDGLKAQGKLHSYEIPAGAIGNRNPIVVADENWYAPDLQVSVYTKHSDPRSGDVVFRLENLKRGEPAPALFTVPPDYTVKDMSQAPKADKAQ